MIVNVETVYRVRIDFDCVEDSKGEDVLDKVALKAIDIAKRYGVVYETFDGCAACSPYVTYEGDTMEAVQKAGNALVQYIKRFKSYKFID